MNLTPLGHFSMQNATRFRRTLPLGKPAKSDLGRRDVSDESVRDAAMLATCDELIAELEARANCS